MLSISFKDMLITILKANTFKNPSKYILKTRLKITEMNLIAKFKV